MKSDLNVPKMSTVLALSLIAALCVAEGTATAASNEWMKVFGKQRTRRSGQRHTTVAAVRGVDEPSEVDPEARNYEAVAKMEGRVITADRVSKFAGEGKLARIKIESPEASGK